MRLNHSISSVVLSRILAAAIQGIIFLALARSLNATGFGIFVSVVAFSSILGVIAGLGTSSLALRLGSFSNPKIVAANISLLRVPSAILMAAGALVFGYLSNESNLLPVVMAAIFYSISEYVSEATESILFGLMKQSRAQLSLLVRRFIVLTGIAIPWLLDLSTIFFLCLFCSIVIFCSRLWLIGFVGKPTNIRKTILLARSFWYSSAVGRLESLDLVITTAVTSAENIGLYGASSRLTSPLNILSSSALSIYTPKMASSGDSHELHRVFLEAQRTMSKLAFLLALAALPVGFAVQFALGPGFESVWMPASLVVCACASSALAQPFIGFFYSTNRANVVAKMRAIIVPISLSIMTLLGWLFGAIGIALGLCVLQLTQAIALHIMHRAQGQVPSF